MLLFENEYINVDWDVDIKCLVVVWKGYANDEKIKESHMKCLEYFKNMNSKKMLVDSRKAPTFSPALQEWMNHVLMPEMVKAGLAKLAYVVPEKFIQGNIMKKMSMKLAESELEICSGSSIEDAKNWLKSM